MGEEVNGSGCLTDNDNRETDWQILHSSTTQAYPGLLLSSGAHSSCIHHVYSGLGLLLFAISMALDSKEHLCSLRVIYNNFYLFFIKQRQTAVLLPSVLLISSLKPISEDQNTRVDSCL